MLKSLMFFLVSLKKYLKTWTLYVLFLLPLIFTINVSAQTLTTATVKTLEQASQLDKNKKLTQAIELLSTTEVKQDYDKAFVQYTLANYLWKNKQADASLLSLQTAIKSDALTAKEQWQAQRMLADIAHDKKDYALAITSYQATLTSAYQPNNVDRGEFNRANNEAYLRLAVSYHLAKPESDEQWQQLHQAISKYNPENDQTKKQALQLALSAELPLKRWAQAEESLNKLIEISPNEKMWWVQLVSVQLQQKKSESALTTFALAKKQGVEFLAQDYQQLANLYAQHQIPEHAARILQEMFNKYPESQTIDAQTQQAQLYQSAREWDLAMETWMLVAKQDPKVNVALTEILIKLKKYQQANQVIELAKEFMSEGEYSLNKINILYQLSDYQMAFTIAENLHQQAPSETTEKWIDLLKQYVKSL